MQKITPHLWFDKEAREAAEFYVSLFPDSRVKSIVTLNDTPSGSVDTVTFELLGREFQAISAGPYFTFNPSVSFQVSCRTKEEVDRLWAPLAEGGTVLMELGAYPFSEWYGWVQDKYGLSWQISAGMPGAADLAACILFVGSAYGRAEEAIRFWTSVFPDAHVGRLEHFGPGEAPDQEGKLKFGAFSLFGYDFTAMESAHDHRFAFNEAISFMVNCESQDEIDYYWSKLSAVPEAEQCGWLKDQFGVSWQIVPTGMEEMLGGDDRERIDRVTQAFLQMKKIDLARLQEVYEGR